MAVDRIGRNRLRNALIGYMQMHITSESFAQCDMIFVSSRNEDHSLSVLANILYNIFDDFSDHPILHDRRRVEQLLSHPWIEATDDEMLRQQKNCWLNLCRTQAFLKTDLEIDTDVQYGQVVKKWKEDIQFFPFSTLQQAESYKNVWLDFSPAFDPTMMEKEFELATRENKSLYRKHPRLFKLLCILFILGIPCLYLLCYILHRLFD